MSCCGGNCGCGAGCGCGSVCKGCKSFPDLSYSKRIVAAPLFSSSASDTPFYDENETVAGEGGGCACNSGSCNCGPNCGCNNCGCCK